jgi:hypothetical protein
MERQINKAPTITKKHCSVEVVSERKKGIDAILIPKVKRYTLTSKISIYRYSYE